MGLFISLEKYAVNFQVAILPAILQPMPYLENKTIGDEGITVDFSIIKVYTSN